MAAPAARAQPRAHPAGVRGRSASARRPAPGGRLRQRARGVRPAHRRQPGHRPPAGPGPHPAARPPGRSPSTPPGATTTGSTAARRRRAPSTWRPRPAFFAADRAVQTLGGMGYATEYHVERYFREARLQRIVPVSQEMTLNYVAQQRPGPAPQLLRRPGRPRPRPGRWPNAASSGAGGLARAGAGLPSGPRALVPRSGRPRSIDPRGTAWVRASRRIDQERHAHHQPAPGPAPGPGPSAADRPAAVSRRCARGRERGPWPGGARRCASVARLARPPAVEGRPGRAHRSPRAARGTGRGPGTRAATRVDGPGPPGREPPRRRS